MELEGKIWKDGKFWLVEISALDLCTQGHTRKEVLYMIEDVLRETISGYFPKYDQESLHLTVCHNKKDEIAVKASDNNLMVALSLMR